MNEIVFVKPLDVMTPAAIIVIAVAMSSLLLLAPRMLFPKSERGLAMLVILFGILLALQHYLLLPVASFGHDVHGHLDYLEWIATFFELPGRASGWLMYHPPLFYALCVCFSSLGLFEYGGAGGGSVNLIHSSALLCFLLLIGCQTLGAACVWQQLADRPRRARVHAGLLTMTLPGFVLTAGRLNNDSLAVFACLAAMCACGVWWARREFEVWIFAVASISCGVFVKLSVLPMFPILVLLAILHPQRDRRACIRELLALALIGGLAIGSYVYWREATDGIFMLVGNTHRLDNALGAPAGTRYFLGFHPWALVGDLAFSSRHSGVEDYLWNFVVRTALLGEFEVPHDVRIPATVLLLGATPALAFVAMGGAMTRGRSASRLSLIFFLGALAAIAANRYLHPFRPSQDFRYIAWCTAPCVSLLAAGAAEIRARTGIGFIDLVIWCQIGAGTWLLLALH